MDFTWKDSGNESIQFKLLQEDCLKWTQRFNLYQRKDLSWNNRCLKRIMSSIKQRLNWTNKKLKRRHERNWLKKDEINSSLQFKSKAKRTLSNISMEMLKYSTMLKRRMESKSQRKWRVSKRKNSLVLLKNSTTIERQRSIEFILQYYQLINNLMILIDNLSKSQEK